MAGVHLIHHIIFCAVTAILLVSIIWVTYRSISENKKSSQIPILFVSGILFNLTAFFGICAESYKSIAALANIDIFVDNPIFFPCNLVFLENLLLVIVLFIRTHYIFKSTPFESSQSVTLIFILAFIISMTIYIVLLTTQYTVLTCAVTLCVFTVFFVIAMTVLFINKLGKILAVEQDANKSCNQNEGFITVIAKIAVLSCISMSMTCIACSFLLVRYLIFENSIGVDIISEWMTMIDIYANFVCLSLTLKYFKKHYVKLCHYIDSKCRKLCYIALVGSKDVIHLSREMEIHAASSASEMQSA
eukprot:437191_1